MCFMYYFGQLQTISTRKWGLIHIILNELIKMNWMTVTMISPTKMTATVIVPRLKDLKQTDIDQINQHVYSTLTVKMQSTCLQHIDRCNAINMPTWMVITMSDSSSIRELRLDMSSHQLMLCRIPSSCRAAKIDACWCNQWMAGSRR